MEHNQDQGFEIRYEFTPDGVQMNKADFPRAKARYLEYAEKLPPPWSWEEFPLDYIKALHSNINDDQTPMARPIPQFHYGIFLPRDKVMSIGKLCHDVWEAEGLDSVDNDVYDFDDDDEEDQHVKELLGPPREGAQGSKKETTTQGETLSWKEEYSVDGHDDYILWYLNRKLGEAGISYDFCVTGGETVSRCLGDRICSLLYTGCRDKDWDRSRRRWNERQWPAEEELHEAVRVCQRSLIELDSSVDVGAKWYCCYTGFNPSNFECKPYDAEMVFGRELLARLPRAQSE
ncbi:hypothetical protein C8Q74DRAFT_1230330 [Fomes fomentarius]|nr:hypothetical protein C8Q74DRAFT_1230330 [Fomes fomentarius]